MTRTREVIALIGRKVNHEPVYRAADWFSRDTFDTEQQARWYAGPLSRMYPRTPYRITVSPKRRRFYVEYVPEWRLRA